MTDVHPYSSHAPVFDVDGTHHGELARDALRVDIEEDIHGLRTFTGHFHAVGPQSDGSSEQMQYLDGQMIDFGKTLKVTLGPAGGERQVFEGKISAIEACFEEGSHPHISVYAEDALMKLRMTRRSRTYTDVSDADIARQIANEHGLTPDVDANGPTYSIVQQWNQSDLAFLRDRAAMIDAELWAQGNTLGFKARTSRGGTELTLVQGNDLLSAQIRADLAHQRDAVGVSGFDVDAADAIDEEAAASVIQREATSGRTGPSVLATALGSRRTAMVRMAPVNAAEATAWAEADMLRRSRGFVCVEGVTSGTPDLAIGTRLRLERVGAPFEGSGYYTTYVHHSFDLTVGYRTRFRAERATVTT